MWSMLWRSTSTSPAASRRARTSRAGPQQQECDDVVLNSACPYRQTGIHFAGTCASKQGDTAMFTNALRHALFIAALSLAWSSPARAVTAEVETGIFCDTQ